MYLFVCVQINTSMHMYMYICMYVRTDVHKYALLHVYDDVCTYVCPHLCVHMQTNDMDVLYMYMCM